MGKKRNPIEDIRQSITPMKASGDMKEKSTIPMERSAVVVIPAYKPSEGFLDFLSRLKNQGGFNDIVVVDDGSGEEYERIFCAAGMIPGVMVLSHYVNLGKGRTLKTAFNYCIGQAREKISWGGVITADADGQHKIQDIVNIGRALEKYPESLVLGCRTFNSQNIPFRSRLGNKVSKLVYRWLCGVNVSDTQTGLRGLPCRFLEECCQIEGERYEYETNMLLKAKEQGMDITEVPIETVYENNNAASHFNPLRDSMKIYAVILKYSLSSILSVVVDYSIFSYLYFHGQSLLTATYMARLGSALVNFTINRNVVFKYQGNIAAQFFKYVLLVAVSGTISGISISLVKQILEIPVITVKVVVELILYFMNFYIQRIWVFAKRKGK
jgi:glycosyltransferase involved in cell wall biosynthesis